MDWELQGRGFGLPSFVTLSLHLVGHETTRRSCQKLGEWRDNGHTFIEGCIPEPGAGVLVALGLAGLGLALLYRR